MSYAGDARVPQLCDGCLVTYLVEPESVGLMGCPLCGDQPFDVSEGYQSCERNSVEE